MYFVDYILYFTLNFVSHRKRMTSKEALDHRWLAEDAARLKTKKINTKNLKRFMARRKWQVGSVRVRMALWAFNLFRNDKF